MKIPVYDNENKDRLLGHLEVAAIPPKYRMEISILSDPEPSTFRRISLDIDVRSHSESKQIDFATREIVTVERKCFLTDAPLADLMELKQFRLPEESDLEAEERRRLRRNIT